MKNSIVRIISISGVIVILALLAMSLRCCLTTNNDESNEKVPLQNPLEVYESAITGLNTDTISYRADVQKESVINEECLVEKQTQLITSIKNSESDFCFAVDEELSIGDHTVSITEIIQNNIIYLTVEDSNFYANVDATEYIQRYSPLVLLDPNLYESVTGYAENEQSFIQFSNPKEQEKWLWDKSLQFETAEGNVVISESGSLLSSTYCASYRIGETKVKLTITTQRSEQIPHVSLPENLTAYTEISAPDAPILLEKACGYLMQASTISATYEDYIECTAFEDRQSRRIQIDAISSPDWSSRTYTTLTYLDHSKAGSDTVIEKEEIFDDGKYSICIDNTEPVFNDSVTMESIRSECLNTIVGTIMLPEQIADAQITESETTYDIIYTANDLFSEQMRANACETLYQNPDILSNQTESYRVDKSLCYLRLDKATGLPIASGFRYVGTYTIDALPYRLEFRADQQYQILKDDALYKIRGVSQQ